MSTEESMNRIVGGQGTRCCYGQPRERLLDSVRATLFEPGQPVAWAYRPQLPPRRICFVEAEVVHAGLIRARIRLRDTEGNILLRWVKPEGLRHKQATEALQLYPARMGVRASAHTTR
jgi:hypothetical protein